MRVLFYNDNFSMLGGAETYWHNCSLALNEQGIITKQIAFNYSEILKNRLNIIRKIQQYYLSVFPQKVVMNRFEKIIQEFQPDLIHLNKNCLFTTSIHKVLHKLNIPSILTIHDYYSVYFSSSIKGLIKNKIHYPIPQKLNFIIPSYSLYKSLASKSRERLHHIPHFVDTADWPFNQARRVKPLQLLFVGRIEKAKGIYVLLDAIQYLKKWKNEIQLVCIGDGQEMSSFKKSIVKRGLENNIRLLGFQSWEIVQTYFSESAILLFSSIKRELFGLVGIEGQACGIPVIASDIGGVREWCIHNETGILVPPNQADRLAEAIRKLLESPSSQALLSEKAYQFVKNRFCKSKAIEQLIALYTDILNHDQQKTTSAISNT